MPKDYTFNGQRPDEKVIDVTSGHPYILYPPGLRSVLLLVIGATIMLFLPKFYLVALVLFLFTGIYFSYAFYSYKESVLIITDQRLLSVEQKGFFRRKISEADLFKILDISSESTGFTKTMLKYGDLIIRTSGAQEKGDIIIKNISNPYYYQQEVTRLMQGQQESMK